MYLKRIIASVLAITVLCSYSYSYIGFRSGEIFSAHSAEVTSGTCGKSMTWSFSNGTLSVSGNGNMDSNTDANPCPWASFKDEITSVIIGKGVESIGISMFENCKKLSSVSLPDTLKTIGSYSFAACSELTSIEIPNGVTNIGSSAFVQCKKLSEVKIPESVTSIGALAFSSTPWLNERRSMETPFVIVNGMLISVYYDISGEVVIPSTVTVICDQAVERCSKITSVTIPESVTKLGYNSFNACSALESVIIPASVENIGSQAFINCTALSEVTVLSPDCKIYDRATTFTNGNNEFSGTIKGYDGSTAESYAKKYGYNFVSLGKVPTLGDPNSDGVVDAKDASFILTEYSRLSTGENGSFTSAQKIAADVNADGLTDSKDASSILGYYAYLSTGGKDDFSVYLKK